MVANTRTAGREGGWVGVHMSAIVQEVALQWG